MKHENAEDHVVPSIEVAVALLREMWSHMEHRSECLIACGGGTEAIGIVLVLSHHRERAAVHAARLASASMQIAGGSIEVVDVEVQQRVMDRLKSPPPSNN